MDRKRYWKIGATLFGVVAASILFYVILTNFPGFVDVINRAIAVISPLLFGALFAFLMNPFVTLCDRLLIPFFEKRKWFPRRRAAVARVSGILLAIIVLGILIYGFFALLLPQLYETVSGIGKNLGGYYKTTERWLLKQFNDSPELRTYMDQIVGKIYAGIESWLNKDLLSNMQNVLTVVTDSVKAFVSGMLNVIIGLIIAIYVLASKEKFSAQAKMVAVALFSEKGANRTFAIGRTTYDIFSGFLTGKLIDSFIIGVLCYIGMRILGLPFPALISVVVGVTNIIPFFGPFIGAVPSTILILLENPLQALYFLIFVLILQQLDGNIIGPKILGDSIGISGFWVLVSITIAGSLFGFGGMLLGVPVFAVIYEFFSEWVRGTLARKNRPTSRDAYLGIEAVDELPAPETAQEEKP